MAVLNGEQTKYLEGLLSKRLEVTKTEMEIDLIHSTLEGLKLDPYTEDKKEDILANAENMGIELSDEDVKAILPSLFEYDEGDYNAYVSDKISKHVK